MDTWECEIREAEVPNPDLGMRSEKRVVGANDGTERKQPGRSEGEHSQNIKLKGSLMRGVYMGVCLCILMLSR